MFNLVAAVLVVVVAIVVVIVAISVVVVGLRSIGKINILDRVRRV